MIAGVMIELLIYSSLTYLALLLSVFVYLKIFESPSYKFNEKETKKRIKLDDFPPFYPNGWLPVLDSSELKKGQVKPIFAFGNDLVAFRGTSKKVTVMDAFCPHLGANLGYGGKVIQESIKCPFHGWVFNQSGNCTFVPGIEAQNLPEVRIKIWDCIEMNGFIFVWNHAKGEKPNWFIQKIDDLDKNGTCLFYKYEYDVRCHVQEVLENAADIMHIDEVHKYVLPLPNKFLNLLPYYRWIFESVYIIFGEVNWVVCPPPNENISVLSFQHNTHLFGHNLQTSKTQVKLLGPALFSWDFESISNKFKVAYNVVAIISKGQLEHRMVVHVYLINPTIARKILAWIQSKLSKIQFDRDVAIFNTKRYLSKPNLTTNEGSIKKFRRWYSQFYCKDEVN